MSARGDAFREGDVVEWASASGIRAQGRVVGVDARTLVVRHPGGSLVAIDAADATTVERDGVRTPRGGVIPPPPLLEPGQRRIVISEDLNLRQAAPGDRFEVQYGSADPDAVEVELQSLMVEKPRPAPARRPFVSRTLLVAAWAAIAFVGLAILVGTLVIGAHLGGPAGVITVGFMWAAGVYAVSARCAEATDSAVAAQAWSMCGTCLAFAAFGSYVAGRWAS